MYYCKDPFNIIPSYTQASDFSLSKMIRRQILYLQQRVTTSDILAVIDRKALTALDTEEIGTVTLYIIM
jgi:hypothetical protein